MGIKTYFCSNVCAAYKKEVFRKLGGFERQVNFNEDMLFAAKAVQAGWKDRKGKPEARLRICRREKSSLRTGMEKRRRRMVQTAAPAPMRMPQTQAKQRRRCRGWGP